MLGLGHTSAVDKVVVDDERHILYCLNQPSTIQVGRRAALLVMWQFANGT
jgi:hypothetical protein